jgi:hypothetical protein
MQEEAEYKRSSYRPRAYVEERREFDDECKGPGPSKRIIVCCDGTMNDGVNNAQLLTNVARIARCIHHTDVHNCDKAGSDQHYLPQIVYYSSGVGTGTSVAGNIIDGATGQGKSPCIKAFPLCVF